jgi:ankyrin repeat protein
VNKLLSPSDSNHATNSILGKRKSRGGADINAKDSGGDTPLHKASLYDHLAVVKALLAVGENILAANNQGELPVHEAVRFRRSAVTKYLLQYFCATTFRLPLHELLKDLTWIEGLNKRKTKDERDKNRNDSFGALYL